MEERTAAPKRRRSPGDTPPDLEAEGSLDSPPGPHCMMHTLGAPGGDDELCRFDEIEVPHAEPVSGSKSGGYGAAAESTDRPAYYEKPVVVHIRPGETAWVRVKPGVYHLRLSEGRKWFGPELMFGPSVVSWGGKEGALAANKASESPFRKQCTE